jgi:molecular chaperone DnaJ
MRDLYEVLGVDRQASGSDLKKAYYKLAKQYHPDHNPNDKEAEDKFKEASNAYQVLSDDDQRARYDRFGFEGVRGGAGSDGFNSVDDIFSVFGDLFGDFFGGRAGAGGRRQARGRDLVVELQLSFAEAVWGTSKDVKVTRSVPCTTCNSTGAKPGTKPEMCKGCNGHGKVVHQQGIFMVQSVCPACHGAGKAVKDPCTDCSGRGLKPDISSLTITVPSGVDDGQALRVAGKGEQIANGQPGDLKVVLRVQGDDRFRRENEDVLSEVAISFAKAALGGEQEIFTLDDNVTGVATIEVKPGTQPGDHVVRRSAGVPRLGKKNMRGDHVVVFKVEVPKQLTAKQEELLRAFAAEAGEDVKEKRGLFGRKK